MDGLELNSRAYYLWNNSLGYALSEQAAAEPAPVASLTKIMTALLTLENRDLEEEVVITAEMLQGLEEFAVIGLQTEQTVTVEDLLYATMLPSAGDAAQALAISTSGSVAAFAEQMNARAEMLGMQNTHFSNPVGFDEDNYSTPEDIVILLREALKNQDFVRIFESFEQNLPSMEKLAQKTFAKTTYIKGGKTGFTNAAGRCLASTAEIEGTEYVLVTVGADLGQNITDAERIYQIVEENYAPFRLVEPGDKLVKISVSGSPSKALEYTADTEATAALPNEITAEELTYNYDGVTEITRELSAGTKLGTYTIAQGENTLYTQELYYTEAPNFYNYGWIGLGGIISLCLLGLTAWNFARRRKKSHKGLSGWLPWASLAALILSLVINVLVFKDWLEPGEAFEVYQPNLVRLDEDNSPRTEPEPGEQEAPEDDELRQISGNCTAGYGNLMLINPNFTVSGNFMTKRRESLISISQTYGIPEYHAAGNGDNLLIPEAAEHLNEMIEAYKAANPGHEMGTYSCFRARGTSCGRLCAATGASDHHTGLTCDLIDLQYGSVLTTDDYDRHQEWQWLRENSYKYGFIDRFPEAWAGGLMSEPLNVDENGSTGLFETWHYRYVGVTAATEIATGKYNNGRYDSLEHYLKAIGKVSDLKAGRCS